MASISQAYIHKTKHLKQFVILKNWCHSMQTNKQNYIWYTMSITQKILYSTRYVVSQWNSSVHAYSASSGDPFFWLCRDIRRTRRRTTEFFRTRIFCASTATSGVCIFFGIFRKQIPCATHLRILQSHWLEQDCTENSWTFQALR